MTLVNLMNFSISWQLVLYPISWVLSSMWLYLFFCLIFMRLKMDLINGLYAFYLVNSALFSLLQVLEIQYILSSENLGGGMREAGEAPIQLLRCFSYIIYS